MAEPFNPKPGSPDRVVRCFWHGPFSPYEALCLSSFVAAGIAVELFSDAPVAGLPAGVTRRPAREILDLDVALYRHEFDEPSLRCIPIISDMRCLKKQAAGGSTPTCC